MRNITKLLLVAVTLIVIAGGIRLILLSQRGEKVPREVGTEQRILTHKMQEASAPAQKLEQSVIEEPIKEKPKPRSTFSLLSGRALDESGHPVKDVELHLYRNIDLPYSFNLLDENLQDTSPTRTISTDVEGRYLFDRLPAGVYRLYVSGPCVPYWLDAPLSLDEGEPFTDFNITVSAGVPLKGVVLNEAQKPASGADVLFTGEDFGRKYLGRARTGADGRYEFQNAPKGTNLFVTAMRDGNAPAFCEKVCLPLAVTSGPLKLLLEKPIVLKGRVFAPDGQPAAGAEIYATLDARWKFRKIYADKDGGFTFRCFGAGKVTLLIHRCGGGEILLWDVVLEKGKTPDELTLKLEQGRSISLTVVDDKGTSIPDTRVNFFILDEEISFRTNERGELTVRGLKDETVRIISRVHNMAPVIIDDIRPGITTSLRIVHNKGTAVFGTILCGDTHQPVLEAHFNADVDRDVVKRPSNARGEYQAHFIPGDNSSRTFAKAEKFARKYGPRLKMEPGKIYRGIDFLLGNGGSVSGLVLEEGTNKPIADAKVTCFDAKTPDVYSDKAGRFKFEGVPEGDAIINASADGYIKPRSRLVQVREGEESKGVLFYLKKGAQISGTVKKKTGQPISNASVLAAWGKFISMIDKSHFDVKEQTGEDGRYTLKNLPPNEAVSVRATHEDYAPADAGFFNLKPGEHRENVDIIMTDGGAIAGRVMDEGGKGLSKAEVKGDQGIGKFLASQLANAVMMHETGHFTSVDEDGRYTLKHLAPGEYNVMAKAKDYIYDIRQGVVVKEGETVASVDFRLKRSVSLAGFVRDDTGKRISGANVSAFMMNFQKPSVGSETTVQDGTFRIEGLAPGGYMVSVEKSPYPLMMKLNIQAPDENLELVLESGGSISGMVQDKVSKKPVPTYKIVAEYSPGGFFGGGSMAMMNRDPRYNRSDEVNSPDGAFFISNLKPGEFNLKVNAQGYAAGEKSGIRVESNKTVEGVLIELGKGVTLEGQVVALSDKTPVSGASVSVDTGGTNFFGMDMDMFDMGPVNASSLTNEEGKFRLENLSAGLTTLEVKKEGFLKGKKNVFIREDVPNEPVVIEISGGGTVEGRVIAQANGEPLAGAEVTFAGQGFIADMMPFFRTSTVTGSDGRFTFQTVPTGRQTLKISHEHASSKLIDNIEVQEGKTIDIGDVALSSGGGIAGIVLDLDGHPVADAFLMANYQSTFQQATTNSQGEYAITELTPGTYTVSLILNQSGLMTGQTGNVQQKQALVEEGKTTELNFTVTPGYNLSGHVTKDGKPAAKFTVSYQLADPLRPAREAGNIVTDADGRYAVNEIQPGVYNITVMHGEMQPGTIPTPLFSGSVEVKSDTVYDISLPTTGISGRVTDAQSGEPIAGAIVSAIRSVEPQTAEEIIRTGRWGGITDTTDADGLYTLEDVQEGDITVIVQHLKYTYDTHPVTLSAGEKVTGVDFQLKSGLSITGHAVLKESGSPVQRLFIHLLNASGITISNNFVTVGDDGQFTITGLSEGNYVMNAYAQNVAPLYGVRCNVQSGKENSVSLIFSAGGTLLLKAFGENEKPVSNAKVDIFDSTGQPLSIPLNLDSLVAYNSTVFTDENGCLERKNILAGSYRVTIEAKGYEKSTGDLIVKEGEQSVMNVKLTPAPSGKTQ